MDEKLVHSTSLMMNLTTNTRGELPESAIGTGSGRTKSGDVGMSKNSSKKRSKKMVIAGLLLENAERMFTKVFAEGGTGPRMETASRRGLDDCQQILQE